MYYVLYISIAFRVVVTFFYIYTKIILKSKFYSTITHKQFNNLHENKIFIYEQSCPIYKDTKHNSTNSKSPTKYSVLQTIC